MPDAVLTPTTPDVRGLMTSPPVTVPPGASLRDVVDLMRQRNLGSVIITVEGRPAGIFTERDLLRRAGADCRDWRQQQIRDLMTPDPWTVSPDTPWQTAFESMQQRAIRHAPVVEDGKLVGMLSLGDIMRHRTALLESVVSQRTAELQRQARVIEERDRERTHSLKIAGRIQRRLLPAVAPAFDPVTVDFAIHPHDLVAGDYFDLQLAGPDTLILIIGDASGHGVPAAFISVIAKTCVHTRLSTTDSPAALLEAMNEFLYGWVEPEHFISMFVAAIHRPTLRMTYARAGHPLPLLQRAGGAVTQLDGGGIMIGVLPNPEYVESTVQLEPGDKVLFFTDGLFECPDEQGELFGLDRVRQLLEEHRTLDGERLVSRLVDAVRDFSATGTFADDLTVALLGVRSWNAP